MDEYKVKYEILLNSVLQSARLSTITFSLYTVDDEAIFAVVKALEPERYEKRVRELEL